MNKLILPKSFILILSALLIGCQTSQEAIEQAIAETQTKDQEYQQQTEEVIQQYTPEPSQIVKSTIVPKSAILYREDFEEGVADDWENIRGEWPVVTDSDGNHYWKGTGQSEWTYGFYGMGNEWSDYVFESRVRLVSGNVYICLRTGDNGTFYAVGLHTEERGYVNISINDTRGEYEWIDLEDKDLLLDKNKWYNIRVTITNEKISLEIDDKLILTAELPIPNASEYGGIGYYTQEGMEVHFDDVRVWSIASPAKALSIAQTIEAIPRDCTANGVYDDFSGDVDTNFLDILKVETTLDEGLLTVTFHLAGLPDEITINQDSTEKGRGEYNWGVHIDVDNDPETGTLSSSRFEGIDYKMQLFNFKMGQEKKGSIEDVLRNWAMIWVLNDDGNWQNMRNAKLKVDYDLNTITLTGNVPEINENSILIFETSYKSERDLLCD